MPFHWMALGSNSPHFYALKHFQNYFRKWEEPWDKCIMLVFWRNKGVEYKTKSGLYSKDAERSP